jgi:hypothetical protein
MITGVSINTAGIDRVVARLAKVADVTSPTVMGPLLRDLYGVIVEDNRRGVMMGLDKFDKPAPPLKYRQGARIQSTTRTIRSGLFGIQELRFKGRDVKRGRMLPNNNLQTWQYKKLTGPRLAPRRDSSRVIANLRHKENRRVGNTWIVEAYWPEVLTPDGLRLLPFHFEGTGRTPKYDLRGVRRWGTEKARHIARAYFLRLLKQAGA